MEYLIHDVFRICFMTFSNSVFILWGFLFPKKKKISQTYVWVHDTIIDAGIVFCLTRHFHYKLMLQRGQKLVHTNSPDCRKLRVWSPRLTSTVCRCAPMQGEASENLPRAPNWSGPAVTAHLKIQTLLPTPEYAKHHYKTWPYPEKENTSFANFLSKAFLEASESTSTMLMWPGRSFTRLLV